MNRKSAFYMAAFGFLFVGSIVASRFYPVSTTQATGGKLFLSPATGSVAAGGNLVVTLKLSTAGQPVNAVQANLTYPTNLFSSVTIANSSAFSIVAENTATGGNIRIARGTTTPVTGTGDHDVAIITFKAASAAGSANVAFGTGSHVVRSTDQAEILGVTTGGTYTVTAGANPSPTPTPSASPTPNPSPTPTPNPNPSPTPSATPNPNPSPTPVPSPTPTPELPDTGVPASGLELYLPWIILVTGAIGLVGLLVAGYRLFPSNKPQAAASGPARPSTGSAPKPGTVVKPKNKKD